MTSIKIYRRNSALSKRDLVTAETYKKLRYYFFRSKAVLDSLHLSSIERLHQIKGTTHDTFSSPLLEQFWYTFETYFKDDPLPVIKLLDSLTGFHYPVIEIEDDLTRHLLKKVRRVLKQVDLMALFSDIDEKTRFMAA